MGRGGDLERRLLDRTWTHLSSMTSFNVFIMATDCSSVKPSLLRRWTNFRVSKWCSLWRGEVAWKALRTPGLLRIRDWAAGLLGDAYCGVLEDVENGSCRCVIPCGRVAALSACENVVCAPQLSRGRRKRGTNCTAPLVPAAAMMKGR